MIKLSGLITEKKELGGAAINVIDTLTDRNNHNIARQQLARDADMKFGGWFDYVKNSDYIK